MKLSKVIVSLLCVISAPSPSACFSSKQAVTLGDQKVPGESPLEYCSGDHANDILQIEYFNLDPNPPLAGQTATIDAKGVFSMDIEEGAYVKLHVWFGPITILKTTLNLCGQMKRADMECPIKAGPARVTKEFSMPKEIPKGKWKAEADIYTKDDERITCVKGEITYTPQFVGDI